LATSTKHGAEIHYLALSPDGTLIILIHKDLNSIAQVWHVGEDSGIIFDTYVDAPKSAFFLNGTRFIIASSDTTRI
jgi:hypothetical protein